MRLIAFLVAASSAAIVSAAPAGSGPVARYTMDASTDSGFAAGAAGGRPSLGSIMGMMSGRAEAARSLQLELWARSAPPAAQASHAPPAALGMGPAIALLGPDARPDARTERDLPDNYDQPKGRILQYWGCGEHVGAGQPRVMDLAKMMPGQLTPEMKAMMRRQAQAYASGTTGTDRDARFPNARDSRPVPPAGSLVGAHSVTSAYSPKIDYSLAPGQDFMAALGMREGGRLPSGAIRLNWTPPANATGYALMATGANQSNDIIFWTNAANGATPDLGYVAPAAVRTLIAGNRALPASASECVMPAEVAAAMPMGMVMMTGYGPWAEFADKPKAPTWTARARFKTSASLMLGMPAMGNSGDPSQPPKKKKKKGFGLGDVLKGAIPIPR